MLCEIGDMIVDREGCGIVVSTKDHSIEIEWSNKDLKNTKVEEQIFNFLIEMERWKIQKA